VSSTASRSRGAFDRYGSANVLRLGLSWVQKTAIPDSQNAPDQRKLRLRVGPVCCATVSICNFGDLSCAPVAQLDRATGFEPTTPAPKPIPAVGQPRSNARFNVPGASQPSCLHGHSALSCASSRQSGHRGLERAATLIQNQVLMIHSCHLRTTVLAAARRMYPPVAVGRNGGQALHRQAAALADGHISQDADRLASRRARRALAALDLRSADTAAPVPKYISSGVCP